MTGLSKSRFLLEVVFKKNFLIQIEDFVTLPIFFSLEKMSVKNLGFEFLI